MQFAEHFLSTYFCRLNFRLLNIDTTTNTTTTSPVVAVVAVVVAVNRLINIVVALVGVLSTFLGDTLPIRTSRKWMPPMLLSSDRTPPLLSNSW